MKENSGLCRNVKLFFHPTKVCPKNNCFDVNIKFINILTCTFNIKPFLCDSKNLRIFWIIYIFFFFGTQFKLGCKIKDVQHFVRTRLEYKALNQIEWENQNLFTSHPKVRLSGITTSNHTYSIRWWNRHPFTNEIH